MTPISRRVFLQGLGGLIASGALLGSYSVVVEPEFMLDVTSYRVTPPNWPADLELKAAVLADIHACEPWMSAERVRRIAEVANALNPDVVFLLGDFNGGHRFVTGPVLPVEWAEALSVLKAPLGVFAVLGNHDWWHGPVPGMRGDNGDGVRSGLRQARFTLLENDAVQIHKGSQPIWIAGLADQMAHLTGRNKSRGVDDLPATMAKITDDAPVVLLAHEPMVFPKVPPRVALTLCGHTHGGQVNLPLITERHNIEHFGMAKVYGHIVEDDRHLIISGGLGTSILPIRFMRPPEVVSVTLTGKTTAIKPVV